MRLLVDVVRRHLIGLYPAASGQRCDAATKGDNMDTKDGGPAWPSIEYNMNSDNPEHPSIWNQHPGLSIRDYFAGQALAGMVNAAITQEVDDYKPHNVAHDAYQFADAMLFARESGLSQSAISAFERYNMSSPETLERIRETVARWADTV